MTRLRSSQPSVWAFVLITLLGVLYSLDSHQRSFWTPNEAFFAMGSRHVIGGELLLPHVYNGVYLDKPPLFVWWTALVSGFFGGVSEWTVRFANMLSSVAVLSGIWVFCRRWMGVWPGLLAIFITGTSYEFWDQSTTAATDLLLTAFLVAAWSAMFAIFVEKFTWRGWLVLWGGIALAMMTKGPVALVLSGMIAPAFAWSQFGWRGGWRRLWALRPVTGLLLALAPFSLWMTATYLVLGAEPFNNVIVRNNLLRYVEAFSHQKPWWYFLIQLPVNMLPWAVLLPWVIWRIAGSWEQRSERERQVLSFAITVTVVVVVFFSVSSSKRDYYILPLMPWFSILIVDALWNGLRSSAGSVGTLPPDASFDRLARRIWGWGLGRAVAAMGLMAVLGYVAYLEAICHRIESRRSPKILAEAVNRAVDEDDQLFIVDDDDPRYLYYLDTDFTLTDDNDRALEQLRQQMLEGHQIDMLVEEDDMKDFQAMREVALFVEGEATFSGDQYYILSNSQDEGDHSLADLALPR